MGSTLLVNLGLGVHTFGAEWGLGLTLLMNFGLGVHTFMLDGVWGPQFWGRAPPLGLGKVHFLSERLRFQLNLSLQGLI